MSQGKQPDEFAAAYAGLIGQVGCVTGLASIIIIAAAFAIGWLLDNYLGTKGIFTVLFLLGSFPITMYVIMRIAMATVARAQRMTAKEAEEEAPPEVQAQEVPSGQVPSGQVPSGQKEETTT